MGTPTDHRAWSQQNAGLAKRLAVDSDSGSQRWAVVIAYYSVMHALQAIAADNGDQRLHHAEVIEIPADYDLPGKDSLEARVRELYRFCDKARYLRGGNSAAGGWFLPFAQNAGDLTRRAIEMMDSVLSDL